MQSKWLARTAVFRTLRFQLASTFLLLLATVLTIVGLGETRLLSGILENQSRDQLKEQIGSLKGWIYFNETDGQPYWDVDRTDAEEEAEVARLQSVFVVADDNGRINKSSDPSLKALVDRKVILSELAQMALTHEPVIKTITDSDGTTYQVISSTMTDSKHHGRKWYVAEGRSLTEDREVLRKFRKNFLIFLPLALLVCAIVSWFSAGTALRALQSVESVAGKITGSNLGLQIPKRGVDDELDRLIESFNEMSRRLKASFEQMRQFSTDVSHELRTPLTAIQGQLEVALFTANSKEQLREAIENALQDVERLSNLVRALLLLSQSESGQVPMNRSLLNLCELIRDLVEQFQIPAEANNLRLSQVEKGPVFCEVDRTQMERVVTNLLSNAIKYTPSGGWVRAYTEQAGSYARIIIEDSGVGIPPDHLPHIFDRFYRVPDPNPEKGLGLGLSFVSAIVKAHGGEIRVNSRLGQGSRFEVTLPVGAAREHPEPVTISAES